MRRKLHVLVPVLVVGLLPGWALGQNRIPELRAQFAQQTNAMRRAQMMPKLGKTEFDEISRVFDSGKLLEAIAKEYRDEMQRCAKGLDAMNIIAENHPKGYKQLEISLRQSLRLLNNLLVSLTTDEQAPFLEVRNDLDELNRHLIHELFPN